MAYELSSSPLSQTPVSDSSCLSPSVPSACPLIFFLNNDSKMPCPVCHVPMWLQWLHIPPKSFLGHMGLTIWPVASPVLWILQPSVSLWQSCALSSCLLWNLPPLSKFCSFTPSFSITAEFITEVVVTKINYDPHVYLTWPPSSQLSAYSLTRGSSRLTAVDFIVYPMPTVHYSYLLQTHNFLCDPWHLLRVPTTLQDSLCL